MNIFNLMNTNTNKLQENDWIICGKSLNEQCKRLRYVEKPDAQAEFEDKIPLVDQEYDLLNVVVI